MTETKKAFRLLFVGVVVSIAVGVFSVAVLLPILPDIDRDRYPKNLQQQGNWFLGWIPWRDAVGLGIWKRWRVSACARRFFLCSDKKFGGNSEKWFCQKSACLNTSWPFSWIQDTFHLCSLILVVRLRGARTKGIGRVLFAQFQRGRCQQNRSGGTSPWDVGKLGKMTDALDSLSKRQIPWPPCVGFVFRPIFWF